MIGMNAGRLGLSQVTGGIAWTAAGLLLIAYALVWRAELKELNRESWYVWKILALIGLFALVLFPPSSCE